MRANRILLPIMSNDWRKSRKILIFAKKLMHGLNKNRFYFGQAGII